MAWEAWVTLLLVVAMVLALARNLASTDALLLTTLAALCGLHAVSDRFPSASELTAGFGNQALVLVGVMYVLAAGVVHTGGTGHIATRLLGHPRGAASAQLRLMFPVATLSGFINNTPVVAMFLPVVKDWSRRHDIDPSRLYLPLSYAAVLGGACTLVGTSTTLVVQSLLLAGGDTPMGMFTVSPVAVPVALAGMLYLVVASRFLLPQRTPTDQKLEDPRRYTVEMEVGHGGPLDGQTIERAGLRRLPGLYIAEVRRQSDLIPVVGPKHVLSGGDRLVLVGVVQAVVELAKIAGLRAVADPSFSLEQRGPRRRFVEAVVSNTSPVVGRRVRESDFRNHYGATIFALHRDGELVRERIGDVVLEPGDTLLLQTDERFVEDQRDRRDFLLVASLDGSEPPVHERAPAALLIFAACVALFMLDPLTGIGILPVAFVAALAMVLTGCCTMEQARRAIDWPVLLSIGASLGIARALESTGAAQAIAGAALSVTAGLGIVGALAGIYLLTVVLTEFVTNNAAAAIAFPIAKATAVGLGVELMPFAVCVAVAASCGFATPLGYQTHMMVYGAGGYRFSDFLRMGVLLDLLAMLLAVALLPWAFDLG